MSHEHPIATPFRTVVPIRRVALEGAVAATRRRYEEIHGSEPEDRGGWFHPDDWHRISFVLGALDHGGSFLDVGLGAGQFINAVAATGWFDEIHGSDPTRFKKYVELHDGIERVDASVAALPYPDDHFDVVTCMEVLEHIPDDVFSAGLAELRRVCRGQLLMSVPYEEPEPISSSHRRRFDADDIEQLFPRADRVLLDRPRMPWALVEERHDRSGGAHPSRMRLAAVEAVLAARPAPTSAPTSTRPVRRLIGKVARRLRRS